MNKVVLIGNGFDLAHELKTSYTDFIIWYLNKLIKKLEESNSIYEDGLLIFKKSMKIKYSKISTFEEFQKNLEFFEIKPTFKCNFFYRLLSQCYNNNWVNIESLYYNELVKIYNIVEQHNMKLDIGIEREIRKLNKCFFEIKTLLSEYLNSIENKNIQTNNDINFHLSNEIPNGLIQNKTHSKAVFLNFNYTSTLESYSDIIKSYNSEIIYIHGKLDDIYNPIIFGYGDEMDLFYEKIERLNSNDFLMNMKSFSYFKTRNYQNFLEFIDSDSFIVYIMGHSCGLSDRILLNSIFEHINCKRIKIFYYQKDEKTNDYFEKTQEISRHFKPENKGIMRRRIVPFINSKPLTNYK